MIWFVKSRRAQSADDYETWVEGGVSPTLNAFDNGNDTRATVIIGQLFEPQSMKEENWVDRDIKNSIRAGESKSSHAIVFTAQRVGEPPRIYENVTPSLLSRMGTGGNNTPMIVAPTVTEPTNFDEYNFTGGNDIHHQIRAGTRQSTGVLQNAIVRRLTPIECERLMGWPDNHTLHRADGKTNSDSARYKMCGNGVATPVARWIGEQLLPLLTDD